MGEPRTVDAGEVSPETLLELLKDGERVVVRAEFLGGEHEVVLRYDGETFYCDTPTTLHKHDSEQEMRTCLENQGYAKRE
jgi:hypothetical protein